MSSQGDTVTRLLCVSLFLLIGIVNPIAAAHRVKSELVEVETVYNPRSMLVFLDESEANKGHVGPLSQATIQALCQNAGPIVVSRALLYNIFKKYTPRKELTLEGYVRPNASDMLNAGNFNPDLWLFKEINPHLMLALPQTYLDTLKIARTDIVYQATSPITDIERITGLKIIHLPDSTVADIITVYPTLPKIRRPSYFIDPLIDNSLFCVHADYKNSLITQPLWAWHIYGHGRMGEYVAGLTIAEFKYVLEYLSTKVNTRLFGYVTCYGAGTNMQRIYEDVESGVSATYPFAIMVESLTDAMTYASSPTVEKTSAGAQLNMPSRYDQYIQYTCEDVLDYEKIAETVLPLLMHHLQQSIPDGTRWSNTPWLRLPGVPWFRLLPGHHDVVTLGKTLVKNRPVDKPLNIGGYFKASPRAILLQSPHIPFDLQINYPELQAILSITPGASTHVLRDISTDKHSLQDTLRWFMRMPNLPREKTFYVRHIHAQLPPDVVISGDKAVGDIYDVIITNKDQREGRFSSFFVTTPNGAPSTPVYYWDDLYDSFEMNPWEEAKAEDQVLYRKLLEQAKEMN